jgi:hypothetical protein
MNKIELISAIETNRRQLERYLFYFEKDASGVFRPSERPKFGREEMLQPGVVDDWALKDLLCHLIDWDGRLVGWCQEALHDMRGVVPAADLAWEELETSDHQIPADLQARPINQVLGEFRQSYRAMLDALEALPDDMLVEPASLQGGRVRTWADLALAVTAEHYAWAKRRIRRWRQIHAGTYLNRAVILERIQTERRRLEQNLVEVPAREMETPGVVGDWSVKDVLAHLVDWEQRFLGWYEAGRRGEWPAVPAPGIGWHELDLLNRQIYERNRERDLEEILADFHASYAQVRATVEAMSQDEIFEPGRYDWLGENALVGPILANTANHYRWAKGHIRAWRLQCHGDKK